MPEYSSYLAVLLVIVSVTPSDESLEQDVQPPVVPSPVTVHQQPHLHHVILGVGHGHGAEIVKVWKYESFLYKSYSYK